MKKEPNNTALWMELAALCISGFVGLVFSAYKTKCKSVTDIHTYNEKRDADKKYDNNHTKNVKEICNNTTDNSIRNRHDQTDERIRDRHDQTDERIRDRHDETDEALRKREGYLRQNQKYGIGSQKGMEPSIKSQPKLSDWINHFHVQHSMPTYKGIPVLGEILNSCPDGYQDAMMLHLLTALGSICFSKVRAQYGGIIHAPSLLTVIEGKQGSGKGKFNWVYKELFQRVIEQDREKLANENPERIIQTTGINISTAKFIEMLAANKGVHLYAVEPEITQLQESSSKKRCLSLVDFRKAFDNDEVDQYNKSRNATIGRFPVYLNCTFTGTPNAISKIFNEKEVEGGTARRFCFTVIPEIGAESLNLHLPKGDRLEIIRNQIDEWRNTYSFRHDPTEGDIPCQEYEINLDYVADALENWCKYQYKLYKVDLVSQRNELRYSMSTIAFRCAIVLHMLLDAPDSNKVKKRQTVKQFAVYIANYCMERYLTKFVPGYYTTLENEIHAEQTVQNKTKLTLEDIEYWYPLRGTTDIDGKIIGYGRIAKHLGVDKDTVRNAFKRYEQGKMT